MNIIFRALLVISIMIATVVHSASFDCAKAATKSETMICNVAVLGDLDKELGLLYSRIKVTESNQVARDAYRSAHRKWLKDERDVCDNVNCMALTIWQQSQIYRTTLEKFKISTSDIPEIASSAQALERLMPSKNSLGTAKPIANASAFQMDVRFLDIDSDGYPLIVAKISEAETSWFIDISITCSWRDKSLSSINHRQYFRPGNRAGIDADKRWIDGTLFDRKAIHFDRQVVEGSSLTTADPDVPRCVLNSAKRVSAAEVANDTGAAKLRTNKLKEDSYQTLLSAYRNFDARCQQIYGPSTADLINTIDKYQKYYPGSQQGYGTIEGQIMNIRSGGCLK